MIVNAFRFFLSGFFIFIIASCVTTTNIIPQIDKLANTQVIIHGKMEYKGHRGYLPRTIDEDLQYETGLTIKYQYHVNYGKENIPDALHFANLFNQLILLGFPIGQDSLVVIGKLDIIKLDQPIKTYSAACSFEKTRSIFYQGPTFTELRRTGLLNVRDNIEAQMYNDFDFLSKLDSEKTSRNDTKGGSE